MGLVGRPGGGRLTPQEGEVSEENENPQTDAVDETSNGIGSLDDALKVIRDLRAENAKRRVASREEEQRLAEYEAWKQSQLTDLEKANKAAEAARGELLSAYREAAASRFNVPEHLVSRIVGNTRDEIFADAQTLGVEMSAEQPPAAPKGAELFGGRQGKPVSSSGDADSILRRRLMGR